MILCSSSDVRNCPRYGWKLSGFNCASFVILPLCRLYWQGEQNLNWVMLLIPLFYLQAYKYEHFQWTSFVQLWCLFNYHLIVKNVVTCVCSFEMFHSQLFNIQMGCMLQNCAGKGSKCLSVLPSTSWWECFHWEHCKLPIHTHTPCSGLCLAPKTQPLCFDEDGKGLSGQCFLLFMMHLWLYGMGKLARETICKEGTFSSQWGSGSNTPSWSNEFWRSWQSHWFTP